jgi:hypothetical protein
VPPASSAVVHRERVSPPPAPSGAAAATPQPAPGPRTFEAVYRDLVVLFIERPGAPSPTVDVATAREARSQRASELFAEMVTVAPDAGQRALRVLASIPLPWREPTQQVELGVCGLILDFNLQQVMATPDLAATRPPLVHAIVGQMHLAAAWAQLARRLLAKQPYLVAEHEPPLLDLARSAAGELQFLAEPVQELLVTSWSNGKDLGDSHYADLLHWFEGGGGASLQAAATTRLLLSVRYRDLVVGRLASQRSGSELGDFAAQAAKELPFAEAIEVVKALKAAAPSSHFGGAYIALVERHPAELREHYFATLGEASHPRHREQMVLALANYAGFDIALAGNADGGMTHYIASSLQNAARHCEVNWLDRATQQALAQKSLHESQRAALDNLRRQYLPR